MSQTVVRGVCMAWLAWHAQVMRTFYHPADPSRHQPHIILAICTSVALGVITACVFDVDDSSGAEGPSFALSTFGTLLKGY